MQRQGPARELAVPRRTRPLELASSAPSRSRRAAANRRRSTRIGARPVDVLDRVLPAEAVLGAKVGGGQIARSAHLGGRAAPGECAAEADGGKQGEHDAQAGHGGPGHDPAGQESPPSSARLGHPVHCPWHGTPGQGPERDLAGARPFPLPGTSSGAPRTEPRGAPRSGDVLHRPQVARGPVESRGWARRPSSRPAAARSSATRPDRRVEILSDHDALHATWSRFGPAPRGRRPARPPPPHRPLLRARGRADRQAGPAGRGGRGAGGDARARAAARRPRLPQRERRGAALPQPPRARAGLRRLHARAARRPHARLRPGAAAPGRRPPGRPRRSSAASARGRPACAWCCSPTSRRSGSRRRGASPAARRRRRTSTAATSSRSTCSRASWRSPPATASSGRGPGRGCRCRRASRTRVSVPGAEPVRFLDVHTPSCGFGAFLRALGDAGNEDCAAARAAFDQEATG